MNRGAVLWRPLSDRPFSLSGSNELEIGFGNGELLTHMASCRQEVTFWGIELARPCVDRACSRILSAGLNNVHLLSGDARFLLRHCFEDNALDRIYMHFPCPWPKKKHARRRVTNRGFADTLASVLKPGARFEFATDEAWYADEVAHGLGDHPALTPVGRRPYRREITTKYERRWIDEGKERTLLIFQKTGECSASRLVAEKVTEEMMHLHVTGAHFDGATLKQALCGRTGGQDSARWAYRDLYGQEGIYLLETVINDDGYEQKFYFKLCDRPEGLLIKPDEVTHPFITPAFRGALQGLSDLLGR